MTRYLLFHALLFVAVAAGCTKTERPESDRRVQPEGYTLFRASTEALLPGTGDGDPFERIWSQGDCIGLFASEQGNNECYTLKRAGYGSADAEFYGPQVIGERIAAYYPYEAALEGEAGAIPLALAPMQRYEAGCSAAERFLICCPRTFAGVDAAGRLSFGYPLGMLAVQIRFEDPVTVTGMTLTSRSRRLAGAGTVDEALALTMSDAASPSIELDCGAGVVSESRGAADDEIRHTSYCFVLPPATYAARDLSLEIRTLEQPAISCTLRELDVRRVSALDCTIATAVVSAGPGGGFDVETGYLEGSVIFAPVLPEFGVEEGYLEPQPELPAVDPGVFETEEGYLEGKSQNTDRS